MVTKVAGTLGMRRRRATQKMQPATMAKWKPETTSMWKEPVRSKPTRSEWVRNVRSPVTMAASMMASSCERRKGAGNRRMAAGKASRLALEARCNPLMRQARKRPVDEPMRAGLLKRSRRSMLTVDVEVMPCSTRKSSRLQTPGS